MSALAQEPPALAQEPAPAPAGDGWQVDTRGREYIAARGRTGVVYRREGESVAEALERDARGRPDKPPKSRPRAKRAPAPTEQQMREIELMLAEVLRSPATFCAAFGDTWAADHFTRQGPELARNLVFASQRNPWLREKLLAAASDGNVAIKLGTSLWLAVSAIGYLLPPIVWWTGLPVPPGARAMFGIPERTGGEDAFPAPAAPAAAAAA